MTAADADGPFGFQHFTVIHVSIIIHYGRALRCCWVRLFFPRLAMSQINLPRDVVKNCHLANTKLNRYIAL